MNDSTEIGRRFSYFKPYFERVDKDDYSKGYYVSDIVYQNDGGRVVRGRADQPFHAVQLVQQTWGEGVRETCLRAII